MLKFTIATLAIVAPAFDRRSRWRRLDLGRADLHHRVRLCI